MTADSTNTSAGPSDLAATPSDVIDFPPVPRRQNNPSSPLALPTAAPKRKGSIVGEIDLGDTGTPALSTMPVNAKQEKESRRRMRVLSASSANMPLVVEASSSSSSGASDDDEASSSGSQLGQTAAGSRFDKKRRHRRNKQPKYATVSPVAAPLRAWYAFRELSYRNSWLIPLIMLAVLYCAFLLSPDQSPANPLHKFLRLSYQLTTTAPDGSLVYIDMYAKGWNDFAFVATGVVFFMFFREFWMQVILRPLALWCGLRRGSKVARFMEQTYFIVYFSMTAPLGLYIMYHNKDGLWFYNTRAFYEHYPHKLHDGLFKLFYLLQASFWAQQSIVLMLQLEKPRKDFRELVFHHIVTIALVFCSYKFHFAMMGIAIFITMDTSDIFLAISKTLNYLDSAWAGPSFIFFIFVWVYLRHYLNIVILWSVLTEFRTIGPFDLSFADQQYKCWISEVITFVLIFALQLVNLYWLFLIVRILVRYVIGGVTKDERSDDEDEEEEEEKVQPELQVTAAAEEKDALLQAAEKAAATEKTAPDS